MEKKQDASARAVLISMVTAGAMSLAVVGTAVAEGAGEPGCGTFTTYLEADRIEFVDHGVDGPSAGDQRLGRYFLKDPDGNTLGSMDFVTTVLPIPTDGDVRLLSTGHHIFGNGTLAISLSYQLPDVTDPGRGGATELTHVVTGGTGAFAHATGSITIVTTADGRRQATYDLKCH